MKAECPECGWSKEVRLEARGKKGKCPECGTLFKIGVSPEAQEDAERVVKAGRFVLVDDLGRKRGEFGVSPGGPELVFHDEYENAGLEARLYDHGPALAMMDGFGNCRVLVNVTDGVPTVTLLDELETSRVQLGVKVDGTPVLALRDRDGEARLLGNIEEDGTVRFFLTDGVVDAASSPREMFGGVGLEMEMGQTPRLVLFDVNGVIWEKSY
ncbi:MAG: hypothetical protein R6X33_13435 [Candidatus Brocadiia bacterium]